LSPVELKNVLFRVDADKKTGLGHYTRCFALAGKLNGAAKSYFFTKTKEVAGLNRDFETIRLNKEFGFKKEIEFTRDIINKYKIDVIITDINHKSTASNKNNYYKYSNELSKLDPLLISFEDFNTHGTSSDYIVIPYVGADKINISDSDKTKYLLGPKYFIIRDEFLDRGNKEIKGKAKNVLIAMGGSNLNNITESVVDCVSGITERLNLHIVEGPLDRLNSDYISSVLRGSNNSFKIHTSPEKMYELMEMSDLGVFSSGLTQYEASAMGLPAIVISHNNYHKKISDEYAAMGSVISFGTYHSGREKKLRNTLNAIINDQDMRGNMSVNGRNLIDGKGTARLLVKIKDKLEE